MVSRTCAGCGAALTKDCISREHILPQWLAKEIHQPDISLKQYRHDEDLLPDELLRSHDLGSFAIKNVCASCNNGWMSRLETRAQSLVLNLMHMRSSLFQLTEDQRSTLSAWSIKTAFMIASVQPSISELPWHLFRRLAEEPQQVPVECAVLGAQLPFLPKGFLYSCPTDILEPGGHIVQVRIGFSIHNLHLVVVIPMTEAKRTVRASGVHIPLWPLNVEIRVMYQHLPTVPLASELINVLTQLVEAGIMHRRDVAPV